MSSEEVSRRSEEGRVLVGLGLLAVVVSYRDRLPKDFAYFLPFPYPHLQVFTLPVFDSAVLIYSAYAVCMGLFFSKDVTWLNGRISGVRIGKGAQRLGHAILVGYTFLLFWYLTDSLGWILVPDYFLFLYGIASNLTLLYIVSLMTDIIFGHWGRTNHRIAVAIRRLYSTLGPEYIMLLSRSWRKYSNRFPNRLSRILQTLARVLGRTIGL